VKLACLALEGEFTTTIRRVSQLQGLNDRCSPMISQSLCWCAVCVPLWGRMAFTTMVPAGQLAGWQGASWQFYLRFKSTPAG